MKEARKVVRALLIILLVSYLGLGQAQKTDKPQKSREDALELESDLVTLDIVATDAKGNIIRDLKREDFQLLQDDQPEKIEFFEKGFHPEQRPIAAVFALDMSGSIEPGLGQVQEQQASAQQFMKLLDKDSEFAVIAFNNEIHILQNFTNDEKRIANAFRKASAVGGSTRIYDAVDRAITMLKKVQNTRDGRRLRRVVIVVTDGYDSSSIIDLKELTRRANDANVTIYSITIPNYQGMPNGQKRRAMTLLDLSELIPHTGGMDYSADTYDFSPIFKSIKEEVGASYTLAFYPSAGSRTDGKFHTLNVKTNRPGIILRLSKQGFQGANKSHS
ncbi:MAG TPA: VWA domain-containing protein [Blastocatellia bacterium]|nr:VWA domain-containing protein [Blastocatellia bacterium]